MASFKAKPDVRIKPFSSVYISTGNGRIKTVLKKGFDALGGIEKVVKPGQSVLIKINLVEGHEAISGGITDVHLCEALVELLKENCQPGTITVGEQTSTGSVTKDTFVSGGWVDMCRRQQVELLDFDDGEYVDVPLKDAMYADVITMPKIALDADVLITFAAPDALPRYGLRDRRAIKNSFRPFVPDPTRRQARIAEYRNRAVHPDIAQSARRISPLLTGV